MLPELSQEAVSNITTKLAKWRQGDCVVGEQWFVYGLNPNQPITPNSRDVVEHDAESEVALWETLGLVVLTQTCDIVRNCLERPFVEVCPLVRIEDPDRLEEIRRCKRPAYAFIPSLQEQCLVADLDRIMTFEKSVVANWERTAGCTTDQQIRDFAHAIARKRNRFAFPDDFPDIFSGLQKRLAGKHSKDSPEGKALRALKEVRVQATPNWDAAQVELLVWFIRDTTQPDPDLGNKSWADMLKDWLEKLTSQGRYTKINGSVTTLADMKAEEYLNSDLLDLAHLSISTGHQPHAMVAEAVPKAAPTTD